MDHEGREGEVASATKDAAPTTAGEAFAAIVTTFGVDGCEVRDLESDVRAHLPALEKRGFVFLTKREVKPDLDKLTEIVTAGARAIIDAPTASERPKVYPGEVGPVSPVHAAFLEHSEAMAQLKAAQDWRPALTVGTSQAVVRALATWDAYQGACAAADVASPGTCEPVERTPEVVAAQRFDRAARLLQEERAKPMPCGHEVGDLIFGGPDTDGRPAVAQCGECLTARKAWKDAQQRTPRTTLEAMLRAYEHAALKAEIAWLATPSLTVGKDAAKGRWEDAVNAVAHIRRAAALGSVNSAKARLDNWAMADYEARLRGDRPLDAPPLENC